MLFFPGRYAIKEPSERIKMAFYRHRRSDRLRSSGAVILADAEIHGAMDLRSWPEMTCRAGSPVVAGDDVSGRISGRGW